MSIDELEELFAETTRHYVGNSFLMIVWGIMAVGVGRYGELLYWVPLLVLLVVWFYITYRWVSRMFPKNNRVLNIYFTKGLLKYGLLGAALFYCLLENRNGLLSLSLMGLLLTYAYDVVGLTKVVEMVEKEILENS